MPAEKDPNKITFLVDVEDLSVELRVSVFGFCLERKLGGTLLLQCLFIFRLHSFIFLRTVVKDIIVIPP
jgi:hypothetical protein